MTWHHILATAVWQVIVLQGPGMCVRCLQRLSTGQCMNGFTTSTDSQRTVNVDWCCALCMLKEENVDWIDLAQDWGQWLAVKMVMSGNEPLHSITMLAAYWVAQQLVSSFWMLICICMQLVTICFYSIWGYCLELRSREGTPPVHLGLIGINSWVAKKVTVLLCGMFDSCIGIWATELEIVGR
jgi:hypothetical protein